VDASAVSGGAWPRFSPVADHALLVSFGEYIADDTSAAVISLDRLLADSPPAGMIERVPAFVNLLIDFDPLLTDHDQVRRHVEHLLRQPMRGQTFGHPREVEICYDEEFAPDLSAVARATGLSSDEVVRHHVQAEYHVRMYGFAPGYAYMSGVPPSIQVPRKPSAVRDIAAGSVLIAGVQCLITTLVMPTGWSVIGRSPTPLFTPDDRDPFLFAVGDAVRFRRIDRAQLEARTRTDRLEIERDG
jgi:inhibitor of KinA